MPKIKTPTLGLVWALWCWFNTPQALGQPAPTNTPSTTSAETVETLLQAENKTIISRFNAPIQQGAGQATATATAPSSASQNKEFVLLAVYGVLADLRIDVKYGDNLYVGLTQGQKAGPFQVVSIDGICALLVMTKQDGRRPVRHCWALTLAANHAASQPRQEPVQNGPLPSSMALPSLPGIPNLLGLARGVTPLPVAPSLPATTP